MSAATPWGRRLLVLTPHPDDEVVGVAAALGRARQDGAVAAVAFLTTGVPDREAAWPWRRSGHAARLAARQAEARQAAQALGLEIVLTSTLASRRLKDDLERTRKAVLEVIDSFKPDRLWVPAFEGAHQDHDAANALAASLADPCPVWEFAEYNFMGGRVRANEFPMPSPDQWVLELSETERSAKRALLALYRSEAANLGHIGTVRECLRPLPRHDYAKPAHPGRLFRERFHWLPFRHPRVDAEPTAPISAILAAFTRPSS
ncbi:MAG: PIG-L family deacetylase [Rhodospirillales bacterium]|nr:PIG-L family deacetylase [Rhodospirillales bacterium]